MCRPLFPTLDSDVQLAQQSCVHSPIYLSYTFIEFCQLNRFDDNVQVEASYQESLICVDNIEEATQKVPHHVEERLNDDVPDLHKPRAVEAVPLDHHDEEVEAGEKGSEDYEGAEDGIEADIEEAMEDGAEIYLDDRTRQKNPF